MNDLQQVLKAGTMLIIETGEYSDRGWSGPVRLLKDTTKAALAEAYRENWRPDLKEDWRTGPSGDDFLPWLIKAGWAEDVENVHAWHVGSYNSFDPY